MSIAPTSMIQIIPRSRRGVELWLLIVAIAVSVGAYVNIGLTVQNKVPASTGYYAAGIGLLALIAHLALRYRATDSLAVRVESLASFAGKTHGTTFPAFLGCELWF